MCGQPPANMQGAAFGQPSRPDHNVRVAVPRQLIPDVPLRRGENFVALKLESERQAAKDRLVVFHHEDYAHEAAPARRGKRMENVLPWPGLLSIWMVPPWP